MKKQNGISLVSLIIYVIVLTVVVGTLSTLQRYFYRNTEETIIESEASAEHSRFLTYITDDINSGIISRENSKFDATDIQLVLNDWSIHEYKLHNSSLYYIVLDNEGNVLKNIVLCKNIQNCNFTYLNGKLTTNLNISGKLYVNNFNL